MSCSVGPAYSVMSGTLEFSARLGLFRRTSDQRTKLITATCDRDSITDPPPFAGGWSVRWWLGKQ